MSVHEALRRALAQEGVLLDAAGWAAARADIEVIGEEEDAAFAQLVGEPLWTRLLESMGVDDARADARRVLGFGRALAAWLIAPVPGLDAEEAQAAARLGGLANFLAYAYDRQVDLGRPPRHVLPPALVALAAAGAPTGATRALTRLLPPVPRALSSLVTRYQEGLRALARGPVERETWRAVRRMYRAQNALLSGARDDALAREKSALPFVVMGLPAWGRASPADGRDEHAAWMREVGEVVGLVDDAVDFPADLEAGRPNLVAAALARAPDEAALAGAVASRAAAVALAWRPAPGRDLRPGERHAWAAVLASWVGETPRALTP